MLPNLYCVSFLHCEWVPTKMQCSCLNQWMAGVTAHDSAGKLCCIHKHLTLFYCWPLSSSGRTRTHTHKHAWTGETFDFLKYWELPSYQWLGRFMVSGPPRKITNVLEPFTQYIGTLGLLRSWLGQSKVLIPDTNLFLTTNTGNRIKTFDFQSLCL